MREREWAAFIFKFGLDQVRSGFRAAIDGCDEQADAACRRCEDFLENNSNFSEDSPEDDEFQELSHAEWLASKAKSVIREAFVLSAFHYWERSMRSWCNFDGNSFDNLKNRCDEAGYSSDPRLKNVNHLCNLIKHDNAKYSEKLAGEWGDLFEELPHKIKQKTEWILALTDDHVVEIFDIVARSGPQLINEPAPVR
jgi:hypothetical protein